MATTTEPSQPRRLAFPAKMRLHKSSEFDRAFREGRRAGGGIMSVQAVPNGLEYCRLGMAVNRAIGCSVQRNRIKRLFREAFRTHQHLVPVACDVVIVPRRPWQAPDLEAVSTELLRLVQKVLATRPR